MGQETNSKSEMCALWILLKLAADREQTNLQVFGDGTIVIDWANGKINSEKSHGEGQ